MPAGQETISPFNSYPRRLRIGLLTLEEIQANCIPEPNTGCLLWLGPLREGYPSLYAFGQKMRGHRAVYKMTKGELPPGKIVCHSCDTKICCNEHHVYAGTHLQNQADAKRNLKKVGRPGKFTKEQIAAIKADPRSHRTIAADYNVTQPSITRAKQR